VCYGLRLAHLQEFPPLSPYSFKVFLYRYGRWSVSSCIRPSTKARDDPEQSRRTLDVNPCTPIRHRSYAEKFLLAAHNTPRTGKGNIFLLLAQAEYPVDRSRAAVKNSDTLWRYRKILNSCKEVKILSEFFRNKLACLNANLCPRKRGHRIFRLKSKAKK